MYLCIVRELIGLDWMELGPSCCAWHIIQQQNYHVHIKSKQFLIDELVSIQNFRPDFLKR